MNRWDDARRAQLERMWKADLSTAFIARELKTSRGAIYMQVAKQGLPRRPRGTRAKPERTSQKRDVTNQRRFAGVISEGQARIVLSSHHPAHREGATIFPSTVVPASSLPRLLKSGENSRKIGSQMAKGRWRGMRLFTLTLEERETCPRTCLEWASCYGNNMHLAQRIADDGTLTRRLWGELASLNAEFPAGFIVRLHVLGDFYSVDYVRFWRQALDDFPALRIFGFTARKPSDPIGAEIVWLVRDYQDRAILRFSGAGHETHSSEVVERPEDATGILCPAESDPERSCATCGLCMQTTRSISFLRH